MALKNFYFVKDVDVRENTQEHFKIYFIYF